MKTFPVAAMVLVVIFLSFAEAGAAERYRMQRVASGLYAALAIPDGKVVSNAMVAVEDHGVVVAGAHFTQEGVKSLLGEIAKITPLPVRQIILTHHHRGYNYFDFDLPGGVEVVCTWQTWQALKSDFRKITNPLTLFDTGLTLQRGDLTIVLRNSDLGHSDGDVIVYFSGQKVLFASDLLFHDAVGFMGDAHLREWIGNLQALEGLGASIVIPGVGQVTDTAGITNFRVFLQDFSTEVLGHLAKGESLAQTTKTFSLPAYAGLPGYATFVEVNIARAYGQLQEK